MKRLFKKIFSILRGETTTLLFQKPSTDRQHLSHLLKLKFGVDFDKQLDEEIYLRTHNLNGNGGHSNADKTKAKSAIREEKRQLWMQPKCHATTKSHSELFALRFGRR